MRRARMLRELHCQPWAAMLMAEPTLRLLGPMQPDLCYRGDRGVTECSVRYMDVLARSRSVVFDSERPMDTAPFAGHRQSCQEGIA